ncbi:MAG: hypothetical protein U9P71_02625 [Campylobacterota bacterium]|nr:hypothetical protein [Campylobacterota bacterium]
MKKVILLAATVALTSSVYAQDMVGAVTDVMKTKIEADAKVAMSKKAKVTVDNSTLKTKTKIGKDAIVVGNTGIVAVGEEVEISNSTIDTDTEIDRNAIVVGNTGVVLGAH